MKIKKSFFEWKVTKKFYIKLHEKKMLYKKHKDEIYFKRNSFDTVCFVQDLLEKEHVKFCFAFGTLLGMVRENNLLKHDLDIDMIVYIGSKTVGQIKNLLHNNGFIEQYEYVIEKGNILQNTYVFNGIRLDIHYCRESESDEFDYVYVMFDEDNKIAKFACPHTKDVEKMMFKDKAVFVPHNPIGFIENMYGENWKEPDKNYKYWESPCVTIMEKKGTIICKENNV